MPARMGPTQGVQPIEKATPTTQRPGVVGAGADAGGAGCGARRGRGAADLEAAVEEADANDFGEVQTKDHEQGAGDALEPDQLVAEGRAERAEQGAEGDEDDAKAEDEREGMKEDHAPGGGRCACRDGFGDGHGEIVPLGWGSGVEVGGLPPQPAAAPPAGGSKGIGLGSSPSRGERRKRERHVPSRCGLRGVGGLPLSLRQLPPRGGARDPEGRGNA